MCIDCGGKEPQQWAYGFFTQEHAEYTKSPIGTPSVRVWTPDVYLSECTSFPTHVVRKSAGMKPMMFCACRSGSRDRLLYFHSSSLRKKPVSRFHMPVRTCARS